jgi:hypothetical protein
MRMEFDADIAIINGGTIRCVYYNEEANFSQVWGKVWPWVVYIERFDAIVSYGGYNNFNRSDW